MTFDTEEPTKVTTIEDHIKRAKELTIPQVSVREEAFTELVKAVEKMNVKVTYLMNKGLPKNIEVGPIPQHEDERGGTSEE